MTKKAIARAWNHKNSRRCMLVVSNSNPDQMEDLGWEGIQLMDKVRVDFKTSGSESRTAYIYRRKGTRKDRARYSFEAVDAEVCPLFKEAFSLYRDGDKQAEMKYTGYKVNLQLIDANMGADAIAVLPKRHERRNRGQRLSTDYNESSLEGRVWGDGEGGLPAAVHLPAEDNRSVSVITMD